MGSKAKGIGVGKTLDEVFLRKHFDVHMEGCDGLGS